MDLSFDKTERLCSNTALEELFAKGRSKSRFPIKVIFRPNDFESDFPARAVFIVPKKKHRRANKRQLIRRRMREVYRLHKHLLYAALGAARIDIMFVYLSPDLSDYAQIEACMLPLMEHAGKEAAARLPEGK